MLIRERFSETNVDLAHRSATESISYYAIIIRKNINIRKKSSDFFRPALLMTANVLVRIISGVRFNDPHEIRIPRFFFFLVFRRNPRIIS